MGREAFGNCVGQEAQVIVAVRILGDAAWAHDVHLRCDLVAGAEPRGGDQGDDLVGVVVHERLGVANGELLERIPHAVVRPGLGEVVTDGLRAAALVRDHVVEDGRGPVDDIEISERSLHDDDARSRRQRPRQLGLDSESIGLVADGLPESVGVVDHHIPLDVVGVVEAPRLPSAARARRRSPPAGSRSHAGRHC